MFSVLTFVSSSSFVSGNIAICHFNMFQWHFFLHLGLWSLSSERRPLLIVLQPAACVRGRGAGQPASVWIQSVSFASWEREWCSIRGPRFGGSKSRRARWLCCLCSAGWKSADWHFRPSLPLPWRRLGVLGSGAEDSWPGNPFPRSTAGEWNTPWSPSSQSGLAYRMGHKAFLKGHKESLVAKSGPNASVFSEKRVWNQVFFRVEIEIVLPEIRFVLENPGSLVLLLSGEAEEGWLFFFYL